MNRSPFSWFFLLSQTSESESYSDTYALIFQLFTYFSLPPQKIPSEMTESESDYMSK